VLRRTQGESKGCKLFQETVISTPKELLGHETAETTQLHTYVIQKPGLGVRNPLDR